MGAVGEAKTTGGRRVQGSFVKLREVAKKVGVHHSTILRWVEQKKVPVTGYKDKSGHWVFREGDIPKFVEYNRSVQPATN